MGTREDLNALLCEILGSEYVYYQPPESLQIQYPCIIYSMDEHYVRHADNATYNRRKVYEVLYISIEPDEDVVDRLADLQYCSMGKAYTADNLYHYPYTLYY